MPIARPCAVCDVTFKADSLTYRFCGPACAHLAARREHFAALGVEPGHSEYHPITPKQKSLHRAGLKCRGLK